MSAIRLERVSFAYADEAPILDHVTTTFPAGWTALVGENGAGKTTLLRLVTGDLAPIDGRVAFDPRRPRVVACPQSVAAPGALERELAAREDGAARRLRATLGLDPGALAPDAWATRSPGERRRWQVGAALGAAPDVLLLDEPTNHADADARAWLVAALRAFRGVGLVVSHDRALLAALAPRTARLHRGTVRHYELPYDAARAVWEAERAGAWRARGEAAEAARAAERRLDEARRARAAAEARMSGRHRDPHDSDQRTLGAKTVRAWAEARLGREVGKARAGAARAWAGLPPTPEGPEVGAPIFARWEPAPRPVLLSLEAAEVRAGAAVVLRDVRVRLGREDRVRVMGPNGAGKSTLLGALLAASTLPGERVLHLPQELPPGAGRALLASLRALAPAARGRLLQLVAALGTDPGRLLASADPSPGEARKLLLAHGLAREAWALVLDEPTNHLDLPSVERLEAALAHYPGAVLLVTHDEPFAERCLAGPGGRPGATWRVTGGRVET